ncbi:helix-turn-helix transcriptional regulator [Kamptonema cortianum]|nr:helix-turn-helix transcriptional regulator [Geitlerinema splendidum]MDK3158698.1 helix-turn-helix transcriptional regulator [Kamptonema cortianum]
MRDKKQPVYMIGVAAELCNVHPQTLRQYERLSLVVPARVGAKNRLYSEQDIERVKQIQRLTQDMGVNLAGVDIILRLLDDMEEMRQEFDEKFQEFASDVEMRMQAMMSNSNAPVRADAPLVKIPEISKKPRKL